MSRTARSRAVLLDRFLQARQRRWPQVLQERADRLDALGSNRVQPARSLTALAEQSRFFEHPEMLRDRLGRDVELLRDVTCGTLAVADELEDAPALRFRQRVEDRISAHGVRPR